MPDRHDAPDESARPDCSPTVLQLRRGDDRAELTTLGGQLLRWRCAGRERLYLSPRARFASGSAIRGGVPVIFPQFADRGPGPRHGFARSRDWRVESQRADRITFVLGDDAATLHAWPHAFAARLDVALRERGLTVALRVRNTGLTPLAFTGALHTYLHLDDLERARLLGLEGRAFRDMAAGGRPATQEGAVTFAHALDRAYPGVEAPLQLIDGTHRLQVSQQGFSDVVVWNPGAAQSARLDDLGPGEHARFVCVEAAVVERSVQLDPGVEWCGQQALDVLSPTAAPTASAGALG